MHFQCLQQSSEWRSSFSSAAIAVLCAYFIDKKHGNQYITDEAWAEFTEDQLNLYHFVYKHAVGNDRKVKRIVPFLDLLSLLHQAFKGPFQGPLIAPILAAHFTAISGSCNVPGLCPENGMPTATLALAVTAVRPYSSSP